MAFTWVTPTDQTPLTTKGDLFTFTTVDARLAVGNNGETLVADSSASTGLRYQEPKAGNPVLNSAFQVWQRGTSFSTASATYTADRWYAQAATNGTVSRQVTGDTTNLPNIQYCVRVQRTAGTTTLTDYALQQPFETVNSIPFAGKTVTLSFYARRGANFSSTSNVLNVGLYSGTGTDQLLASYTGLGTPIVSTATLTTTWQRFTYTGSVGATATELAVNFYSASTGTAGAADYYEITGVQLEVGSVATAFKTYAATIQGELSACERYFQIVTGQMCSGSNTTTVYSGVNFRTQMRTAPSVALSAAMTITDAGADYTQSSASVSIVSSRANSTGAQISMPNFTSTTAHRPYSTTVTASQIQFSAEL
jgi:hypothetical protein